MCCPVCGKVHTQDPLLLIEKNSLCGDSRFPLKRYVTMTMCLTSNSPWYENPCALEASLVKAQTTKVVKEHNQWRVNTVIFAREWEKPKLESTRHLPGESRICPVQDKWNIALPTCSQTPGSTGAGPFPTILLAAMPPLLYIKTSLNRLTVGRTLNGPFSEVVDLGS